MIVDMMKENKLFASQGGPIILSQVYIFPIIGLFDLLVTLSLFVNIQFSLTHFSIHDSD